MAGVGTRERHYVLFYPQQSKGTPDMKQYKIIIVENDPDEQFFMKESFDTVDLFQILAQVK